ncbi:calcium-independent phospholipase A2 [Aphelenchoides avenae]|nr:calcium-independent phospholipase A2 [Aphelenchus avenae]
MDDLRALCIDTLAMLALQRVVVKYMTAALECIITDDDAPGHEMYWEKLSDPIEDHRPDIARSRGYLKVKDGIIWRLNTIRIEKDATALAKKLSSLDSEYSESMEKFCGMISADEKELDVAVRSVVEREFATGSRILTDRIHLQATEEEADRLEALRSLAIDTRRESWVLSGRAFEGFSLEPSLSGFSPTIGGVSEDLPSDPTDSADSNISSRLHAFRNSIMAKVQNLNPSAWVRNRLTARPTTLHEACQEGDFGSAFKFVVDGADVNAQDSDGKTPLYHAVKSGNEDIVHLLLGIGDAVITPDAFVLYADPETGAWHPDPEIKESISDSLLRLIVYNVWVERIQGRERLRDLRQAQNGVFFDMVAQHKKVVQLLVENGTLRERLHRYDEYNAEQDALLGTLLTKRADEAAVSDSAKCSATEAFNPDLSDLLAQYKKFFVLGARQVAHRERQQRCEAEQEEIKCASGAALAGETFASGSREGNAAKGPTRKHPEFLFEAIWDYVQIEGLLKENEALCERLQRYQAQQGFAQGTSKLAFAHGTLTSDNGEALNSELFYEATILRKAITQHLLAYNIAILDRQRLGTAIAEDNKAKGPRCGPSRVVHQATDDAEQRQIEHLLSENVSLLERLRRYEERPNAAETSSGFMEVPLEFTQNTFMMLPSILLARNMTLHERLAAFEAHHEVVPESSKAALVVETGEGNAAESHTNTLDKLVYEAIVNAHQEQIGILLDENATLVEQLQRYEPHQDAAIERSKAALAEKTLTSDNEEDKVDSCANTSTKRDVLLAADGGGVRGIISATIVIELERLLGTSLLEKVDFMAGVSTGAIFLAALTQQPARECLFLYLKLAADVFVKRLRKWKPYNSKALEDQLKKTFDEDKKLIELGGPKFVISAASTKQNPPGQIVFRNYTTPDITRDDSSTTPNFKRGDGSKTIPFDPTNTRVWAALRCSSAAPTYFLPVEYPPHPALSCNNPDSGTIEISDGGLCNNNPSELLLDEYTEATKGTKRRVGCFISLGTGSVTNKTDGTRCAGIRDFVSNPQHLKNLIKLILDKVCDSDGTVESTRERVQGIHTGGQYFRFQPNLKETVDLDETDPRKLVNLVWTAKKYMMSKEGRQEMQRLIQKLREHTTNHEAD